MPNFILNYVTYAHRHRRQHGSAVADSQSLLLGMGTLPNPLSIPAVPATHFGKPYAFTSVVGGQNGPLLYSGNELTPSIPVDESSDIIVTVFYLPAGGPGVSFQGIWIDAFDEETGQFMDDDFVTVVPNSNNHNTNLTDTANAEGEVSNEQAEEIIATSPIRNLVFDKWVKVEGTGIVTSHAHCTLAHGGNGVAFAFYKKRTFNINDLNKLINPVAGGGFRIIIEDDGIHIVHGPAGPGSPVGPPVGPLDIAPSVMKRISKDQQTQLTEYLNQYSALTKTTAADMDKIISILTTVNKMIK